MAKFLYQYEPRVEDFVGSHVELQGGGIAQVNPHPGYHIMVYLNTKSELLRLVSMCIIDAVMLNAMLHMYLWNWAF